MTAPPPPQKTTQPKSVYYRLAGEPQQLASDGTWGTPLPATSSIAPDMLQDANPGLELDVEVAAKLAVMEVLLGSAAREINWLALVQGRAGDLPRPQIMHFTADRIALDWPDAERDDPPSLSVTIRNTDAGLTYDPMGLGGPDFIDDSADVFAPGTVLVREHDVTGVLVVEMLCASKTIRDGVRRALRKSFAREPHDDRGGRRIVVRPYFDRTCRIELAKQPFSAPDDGDEARGKRFPLLCFLDIDINDVRLVARPAFAVRPPVPRLYVTTS